MKQETLNFLKDKKILVAMWDCCSPTDRFARPRYYTPFLNKVKQIDLYSPRDNYFKLGRRGMNKQFLNIVKQEKYDIIFMMPMHYEFSAETLKQARENCDALIGVFGDDSWRFDNYTKYYAPFFDYIITNLDIPALEKYKQAGYNNVFLSHACGDENWLRPINTEKIFNVGFIGSYGKQREEYIDYLIKNGVQVDVWGKGWEGKSYWHGFLSVNDFPLIINKTKINLNFTVGGNNRPQIKGRPFEVGACRSFILSEYASDYRRYFTPLELPMFKDKEELLGGVNYYLNNPRERKIAEEFINKRITQEYSLEAEFDILFERVKTDWNKIMCVTDSHVKIKKIWDKTTIKFMLAGLLRVGKWKKV